MKRFFWILALAGLGCSSLAQEERYINRSANLPYDGVDDIRAYLLKRNFQIFTELKAILADYRKTARLPDGIELNDNSQLFVNRPEAPPSLCMVEIAFTSSFVWRFHSEISGRDTRIRLLNRGFSPQEFEILAKYTSEDREIKTYYRQRRKAAETLLEQFGYAPSDCTLLAYKAIIFKYVTEVLSRLSLPSRRAVLAYIFEFTTRTADLGYDTGCLQWEPSVLIEAMDRVSARDDLVDFQEGGHQ